MVGRELGVVDYIPFGVILVRVISTAHVTPIAPGRLRRNAGRQT